MNINQSIFYRINKQNLSMRSSIRDIPLMHSVHLEIYNQSISPGNICKTNSYSSIRTTLTFCINFYHPSPILLYRKYTDKILNMYMMNMIRHNLVFKTVYCIIKSDAILYHLFQSHTMSLFFPKVSVNKVNISFSDTRKVGCFQSPFIPTEAFC